MRHIYNMAGGHFLVLTYPAQGHINPNLELSMRLLRMGVRVTFATSVRGRHFMPPPAFLPKGLNLLEYSDGFDGGIEPGTDTSHFMSEIKRCGTEELRRVMSSFVDKGCPVSCLAYSLVLPWAAAVAREFQVPSALVWIQPATVFDIYYHYFHGYDGIVHELASKDPSATVTLPDLPLSFAKQDLPSFMMPTDPHRWLLDSIKEHMDELDIEVSPRVLVNTFEALEPEALASIRELKLTAVGPLVPSLLLNGQGAGSCSGVNRNSSQESKSSYIEWLDTKPDSSVIYVSFGSISVLSKHQMEEIAKGLLDTGKPFLWIIRKSEKKEEDKEAQELDTGKEGDDDKLIGCIDELTQLGLIIPWCSQVQVLSHPAISCFLTHCGWNSTLESLVSGVPMVGFPQWTDQGTNAKLVEDYWKTGARVKVNGDGLAERDEINRCLDLVIGNVEMRQNAEKWKMLAVEAAMEDGSSDQNLKYFIQEVALSPEV